MHLQWKRRIFPIVPLYFNKRPPKAIYMSQESKTYLCNSRLSQDTFPFLNVTIKLNQELNGKVWNNENRGMRGALLIQYIHDAPEE